MNRPASQVELIHHDLETSFIEFSCIDKEIKEYLKDNPTLQEVNCKDLDTLTTSAKTIYKEADNRYQEFHRKIKQKKEED